jgi:hypothetical protein
MFIQLFLAIFYAVGFSVTLAQSNNYYIYPPIDPEDDMTGDAPIIRSQELSFQCNGHTYYKECQGPGYENGYNYDPTCDEPASSYESTVIAYSIFFSLMIISFVGFCYHRLYYGFYNELSGLVKFKKKVSEDGQVIYKPVKFAVAYSLFCNYAKGGIAVFLK